jgi:hypothetical protein
MDEESDSAPLCRRCKQAKAGRRTGLCEECRIGIMCGTRKERQGE